MFACSAAEPGATVATTGSVLYRSCPCGWMPSTPEVYFCALIAAPSPGASFDPAAQALCGGLWFLNAPGDPQGVSRGSPPWVAARINVVTTVPAWGAPFVMLVHVARGSVIEDSLVWVGVTPSR